MNVTVHTERMKSKARKDMRALLFSLWGKEHQIEKSHE